ncbi:hypothetical protein [Limimaricola soesokkakensis]|uniref:hypothetical protein n=1 Tax=Limimaricola soesokkakensis TaxID=1343159 RepID=UPI001F5FF9AF|nr:hypothetical protein [Limimaricola soesokkakensis]
MAECGTDLTAWPSAKHFTSWLCHAPGNKIPGGQAADLAYSAFLEPCGRTPAVGRDDRRAQRHRSRRILLPSVIPCRQAEGRDRHGAHDRRPVLQHPPVRESLPRSRRGDL